jgi:hypothetical protein
MRRFRALLLVIAFNAGNSRDVAAEDAHPGDIIMLPPFLVEDQRVGSFLSRTDWLHFQDGNIEILSACPEDETEQVIRDLRQQRAALNQFVPDELLLRTSLPTTLILFPKTEKNAMDEQLVSAVNRIPRPANVTGHFSPMNDLRLSDPDSTFIFVILDDWQWGWDIRHGYPKGRGASLFYSPPYLRYLVGARAPQLPGWFVTGISLLYESIAFNDARTGTLSSAWTAPNVPLRNAWENSVFEMDPWMSRASVAALREHADAPRPLLPMRELFVPTPPTAKSEMYRRVWEAQAELFVRWAFSDRIKDGRNRLYRFVEAAAAQPVTEELFQACFGLRYSDARDALSDFLPAAVDKELHFDFAPLPFDRKAVDLREATPEEVHRIKGEWARRTLQVFRSKYPDALPLFVAKVRNLLQGSYDRGERDPPLLASLALFRLDIGDERGGRRLLEENPAAVAARPLAGLELARLRMNGALAGAAGASGILDDEQAGKVLEPISEALAKEPTMEAAYLLATRVSEHLKRDPTDAERARLNEGARLFPRDSKLVMNCISWDIRAHDFASARALIDLGEYEAAEPSAREKYRLLDNVLVTASTPSN